MARRSVIPTFPGLFSIITMVANPLGASKPDEILDQPVRERIVEYLRANPMASKSAIGAATGCAWGLLQYHLRVLLRHKLIRCLRVGDRDRFFLPGMKVEDATQIGVLRRGRTRDVAVGILRNPGAEQRVITEELGMSRKMFRAYVDRLIEVGLVTETVQGRSRIYCPASRLEDFVGPLADAWSTDGPDQPPELEPESQFNR